MAESARSFKNVIRNREAQAAQSVDDYLAGIDAFIEAHNPYRQNKVIPAIGNGTASRESSSATPRLYYSGSG